MPRSKAGKSHRPSLQAQLREAEHQLREQQEQALVLLRSIGQFTLVISADGTLRDADLWRAFTGQSTEAAQGHGWLLAIHPDDRASMQRRDPQTAEGRGYLEAECRIRRHDGLYRACMVYAIPVMDANGELREWLGVCTDITEQTHLLPPVDRPVEHTRALAMQLAAALEAMSGDQLSHEASADVKLIALLRERAQLTHEHHQARVEAVALSSANQRMDDFLAVAAHDLRSPIAASIGYIQLAMRRVGDLAISSDPRGDNHLITAVRHSLDRADQSLHHLTRLADRLLDIGRIKSRKLQLSMQRADLVEIVREVVEDLRQTMPEHAIHLIVPPEQSIPVFVDRDRIGQVVSNFLTNAHRYTPSDRPITVTVETERVVARVSVHDEGRGIPVSQQRVIWRRFEQAQRNERQGNQGSGLGLGLFIAKTIVAGHHGRVGVSSRVGHGATFWFALPLANQE